MESGQEAEMEEGRGILLLEDPLRCKGCFSRLKIQDRKNCTTLVFDENERYFHQAQAAYQHARKGRQWLCIAAEGAAAGIALALAAQLTVDRLALWCEEKPDARPREILRIDLFARRNLSLVACEILLVDASAACVRRLSRSVSRASDVRAVGGEDFNAAQLTAPWEQAEQFVHTLEGGREKCYNFRS